MAGIVDANGAGEEMKVERSVTTLRSLTLEKMRDAILDFRFKPGERLVERTLCERLGVSRSVVREVLRHLEAEGLVETIPHQGPAVTRPDPKQAAQIYEIRGLLESEAARACALTASEADIAALGAVIDEIDTAFQTGSPREVLRRTTEFYEKLFVAAGKEVAWDVVRSLNARINHLRSMTIAAEGRHADAIAEMRALHAALLRRDGEAAYAASRAHVATVARLANAILGTL
ncbi:MULTISPECIES: GntR family transcriptional regulator [unclassified Ancylobacter]|uniref:GntR family transcriptional regulator n=1 Tax=unclassified Ancylobacter TaxID=2626613 RepID=UPI0022707EBB|nr:MULTISPECIES: GntR family transcriptional regulator [unclassified Ancylobacter]WAC28410.1 GntR family transcriptional regulator [Ancylobacter sp. SL191]WGD29237.1 GntR family transcriptional regulator [Ancylobacter sp. WKF20]